MYLLIRLGFRDIIGIAQTDEEIDEMIRKMDNNESGAIDYSGIF